MAIFPNIVGQQWRGAITIPGNGTAIGANLLTQMRAGGYPGPDRCVAKVLGLLLADASDRPAFDVVSVAPGAAAVVAGDFTTRAQVVKAGGDFAEPSDGDALASSVRSRTVAPITAQIVAVW